MENLIIVKQLPIIEQRLKELSNEIKQDVAEALSLEVTEETVKSVKNIRARLTKDSKELESKRKEVKKAVLKPYDEFETVYKENILNIYKEADKQLKERIDTVESKLKADKETVVIDYFESRKAEVLPLNDFIKYEDVNVNVTLTASMKSLKKQVDDFLDTIASDLVLIDTQDNKAEILVEYKIDLNVSRAITTVKDRLQRIKEEEKKKLIVVTPDVEEEIEIPSAFDVIIDDEEVKDYTLLLRCTCKEMEEVTSYLNDKGINYV